jgi:lipopolysaccharide export system protein LptC
VKIVYLIIAAAVLVLTVWNLWTEKDWRKQATAAMVAVPLLLRVILIK